MNKRARNPSWITGFLAVLRYELLWDIRKKKFIGVLIVAFVLATLGFVLPVALSPGPVEPNPNFAVNSSLNFVSIGFFLFALVSVMNSISSEFESGSIIPLLTKPVSRTTIYLGKVFAAFLLILGTFLLLTIYLAAGGYIIYGPQNNLHLLIITLLGSIMSTMVWMSIVLAVGSISKSSMLVALLGIGIWLGLNIASGVVTLFSNQAWIQMVVPGTGAQGTLSVTGQGISTGTDGVAANLIAYILHPTADVTFSRLEIQPPAAIVTVPFATQPLSLVAARSTVLTALYILVFNIIAWYALKRAQAKE